MLLVTSRRDAAAASQGIKADDTQLEFSESLRRTQDAVARQRTTGCLSRWCCCAAAADADTDDKYAVDVLATEIDSLKRAVREVRLYIAVLRPTCCHSRWDRPLTGVNVIDIQYSFSVYNLPIKFVYLLF